MSFARVATLLQLRRERERECYTGTSCRGARSVRRNARPRSIDTSSRYRSIGKREKTLRSSSSYTNRLFFARLLRNLNFRPTSESEVSCRVSTVFVVTIRVREGNVFLSSRFLLLLRARANGRREKKCEKSGVCARSEIRTRRGDVDTRRKFSRGRGRMGARKKGRRSW